MPLVTIWITTYNHEKFISEAIEGVLMQQTNFSYEMVIGDDCSTDGTREILIGYKEKYPNIIRLFLPEQNMGMIPMFKATYSLCSGHYVAWLDGDDYWTDRFKLQKQVDFLESNHDFVMCFHNVRIADYLKNIEIDCTGPLYKHVDNTLSIQHILHDHNQIFALSVVHRNVLPKNLPDWFYQLPFPDWGFYTLLSSHGKFKYLDEIMGVYRIHKAGSYSGLSQQEKFNQIITFFTLIKGTLGKIPTVNIDKVIAFHYYKWLEKEIEVGKLRSAINQLFLSEHKSELFQLFIKSSIYKLKYKLRIIRPLYLKFKSLMQQT